MSDTEKAIAEAASKTRAEVLVEFGGRLAAAEIRAALVGIVADPTAIIDDLNLSRFIAEDGAPDPKAIEALRAKYAALIPTQGQPKVPTGKRNDGPAITREALKSMSPEQIDAARRRGDLDHLLRA